jgi:four helix bundle suffix protein
MFPKHKYLLTYRYSEIIHDLTVYFCNRFLTEFDFRRTREQMIQAARSGKQNIVEGIGQSTASKKGEIKLLNVAKASLEELTTDYEDFLRQRNLPIYAKTDSKVSKFRLDCYRLSDIRNLNDSGEFIEKPILPATAVEAGNFLLTLCHLTTYLLLKQIAAAEQKFLTEGGYTENLWKRRENFRKGLD